MDHPAESNKALVLEAFDTLFNKRDYAAAENFWLLQYIQHSAHIEPGRPAGGKKSVNAVWSYEDPFPAVARRITGM